MSVVVPRLRAKVNLAKAALGIVEDREFATLIGVSPSTLTGYFSKTDTAPDAVPEVSLERMAGLVADRLPGRLTLEHARLAWAADWESFQLAIGPFPRGAFGDLLASIRFTLPMGLETTPPYLEMTDADPPDPTIERVPESHSFQLVVTGPERDFLVVIAATPSGWHLAAPRDGLPIIIPGGGQVRAPRERLKFTKGGGLHTFYAFAIRGGAPPRLIVRGDRNTTLDPEERMIFATDLQDPRRVRAYAVGRLMVFADPAL